MRRRNGDPDHGVLAASPGGAAATRSAAAEHSESQLDPVSYARAYLESGLRVYRRISPAAMGSLIEILMAARDCKRHVFMCGNGGSAATASHFASGLGKDGSWGREQKFRVLALTDNVPWITSLANDTEYAQIFVEQLKNYAEPDDVVIAFSGSGNSPNVVRAIQWGNENGLVTVGITGRPGGQLAELARNVICVDSSHIGHVEEGHFFIQHLITYYFIERG